MECLVLNSSQFVLQGIRTRRSTWRDTRYISSLVCTVYHIYIYILIILVCLFVCKSDHNSGTP